MSAAPATQPLRFAVVGHPVAHSKSPGIHQRFAELTGLPTAYERVLAPLDGFAATVERLRAEGFAGCNVTVPFKFEAAALAPRRSQRVQLCGAANTLGFGMDGMWCDNTDGPGLVQDITVNAGVPLAGARVLLLGAGGAAAGVLGALLSQRPAALWVANRNAARAIELVATHADLASESGALIQGMGLDDVRLHRPDAAVDVLINATSASLADAGVPVGPQVLRPGTLALDMMYGPAALGFAHWAASHGAEPRDGLGMLVEQAAESFALWRGVRPPSATVLAELRHQLATT